MSDSNEVIPGNGQADNCNSLSSDSDMINGDLENKDPIVISMFTHKGGVGKTTATYNMGARLASKGYRVLLVDADSQRNLSKSFIRYFLMKKQFGGCNSAPSKNKKMSSEQKQLFEKNEYARESVISEVARFFMGNKSKRVSAEKNICIEILSNVFTKEEIKAEYTNKNSDRDVEIILVFRLEVENSEFEPWYLIGEHLLEDNDFVIIPIPPETSDNIFSEEFTGLLDDNNASDEEISEKESEIKLPVLSLLGHSADSYVNEIFTDLVDAKIEIFDAPMSDETCADKSNAYLLTHEKKDLWFLHYFNFRGKKAKIDSITNAAAFKKTMENYLSNGDVNKVKKYIKSSLCYNFLDAFNPKALKRGMSKDRIHNLVNQLHLLTLKDFPKENSASEGELMLMPGNAHIVQEWGRQFSVAIEGIKADGIFSNHAINISALNEFLRYSADLHGAHIVLIDLNPSADDFNASMVMVGDYFLTTVNPEMYSDDAVDGLAYILNGWFQDFKTLYANESLDSENIDEQKDFRAISNPPKCLGLFLQKCEYDNKNILKAFNARSIATTIKQLFDSKVVPFLVGNQMYPPFGIVGYGEDGEVTENKMSRGILRFNDSHKGMQRTGQPLVWSGESSIISSFDIVLNNTIGRAVKHHFGDGAWVDPPLRMQKSISVNKHKTFHQYWPDEFKEAVTLLTQEQRTKVLKDKYYKYDAFDMMIILSKIRFDQTKSDYPSSRHIHKSALKLYYPNKKGILILHPTSTQHIKRDLRFALDTVSKDWPNKKVNWVIVPFFEDVHWRCIRVHLINNMKLNILYDDPRGAKEAIESRGTNKKKRHIIKKTLLDKMIEPITRVLLQHIYNVKDLRTVNNTNISCKLIDQQGYLFNDTDSGLIVIMNIQQYLSNPASNRQYAVKAEEYDLKNMFLESDHRYELVLQEKEPSRDRSVAYTVELKGNSYSTSSEKTKIRRDHANIIQKYAQHIQLSNALQDVQNDVNAQHTQYLKKHYKHIMDEPCKKDIDALLSSFNSSLEKVTYIAGMVTEIIFQTYGKSRGRKTLIKEGEGYAAGSLKQAHEIMKSSTAKKTSSSKRKNTPIRCATQSSHPARSPMPTRSRQLLFSASDSSELRNGASNVASSSEAGNPKLPKGLAMFNIAKDGHCFYNAVLTYSTEITNLDLLRFQVADELKRLESIYRTSIEHGDIRWDNYLKNVRNGNEFAQEPELRIIASIYDRPIVVIHPNPKENVVIFKYSTLENTTVEVNINAPPIFVYYDSQIHYSGLYIEGGEDGVDILAGLTGRGEVDQDWLNACSHSASVNVSHNVNYSQDCDVDQNSQPLGAERSDDDNRPLTKRPRVSPRAQRSGSLFGSKNRSHTWDDSLSSPPEGNFRHHACANDDSSDGASSSDSLPDINI